MPPAASDTSTEARLEALSTALDAYSRAEVQASLMAAFHVGGHALCRAESRLLDAAIDCGMPHDAPSVSEWAATRVAAWLVSA